MIETKSLSRWTLALIFAVLGSGCGIGGMLDASSEGSGMALSRQYEAAKQNLPGDCYFEDFFRGTQCSSMAYPEIVGQVEGLLDFKKIAQKVVSRSDHIFLRDDAEEAKKAIRWVDARVLSFRQQIVEIRSELKRIEPELEAARRELQLAISRTRSCSLMGLERVSCRVATGGTSLDDADRLDAELTRVERVKEAIERITRAYQSMSNSKVTAHFQERRRLDSVRGEMFRFRQEKTQTFQAFLAKKSSLLRERVLLQHPEFKRMTGWFRESMESTAQVRALGRYIDRLVEFYSRHEQQWTDRHIERIGLSTRWNRMEPKQFDYHWTNPAAFRININVTLQDEQWGPLFESLPLKTDPRFTARVALASRLEESAARIQTFASFNLLPITIRDFSVAGYFFRSSMSEIRHFFNMIEHVALWRRDSLERDESQLRLQGGESIQFGSWNGFGPRGRSQVSGRNLNLFHGRSGSPTDFKELFDRWWKVLKT